MPQNIAKITAGPMMNTNERVVYSGKILVSSGFGKTNKVKYLKATCGVDQPAALKLFKDVKSAARGKSWTQEILFINVGHVCKEEEDRKVILRSFDGSELFSFCATSDVEEKEWIKFCTLFCDLPYFFIPEQPNYSLVPQNFIARHDDSSEFDPDYSWVVNITHKSAGLNITEGLYIAADCGSTFNLYDCSNQNTLVHIWNSNMLKWFGYTESLVFIAVRGESAEGLSLLWMNCKESSKMCDCLESLGKLTCIPQKVEVTDHSQYRSRGFSDSGILSDSIDSEDELDGDDRSCDEVYSPTSKPMTNNFSSSSFPAQCNHSIGMTHSNNTFSNVSRLESALHVHVSRSNNTDIDENPLTCQSTMQTPEAGTEYIVALSNTSTQLLHSKENIPKTNDTSNEEITYLKSTSQPSEREPHNNILSSSRDANTIQDHETISASLNNTTGSYSFTLHLSTAESQDSCSITSIQAASHKNGTDTTGGEQIKKKALRKNRAIIIAKLDAYALHPLLCSEKLLNNADSQVLLDKSKTHYEKAVYLVHTLPRKHKQWFQSFLSCLQQSTLGTGHDVIYTELISTYKKLASAQNEFQEHSHDSQLFSDTASTSTIAHQLSIGHSSIPLDIKNIAEMVITNMAAKWYLMGVQLGVDQNELNNIKHDNHDSKTACLMMFTEWFNNTETEKSWNTLLEALQSQFVGESCLANNLIKRIEVA